MITVTKGNVLLQAERATVEDGCEDRCVGRKGRPGRRGVKGNELRDDFLRALLEFGNLLPGVGVSQPEQTEFHHEANRPMIVRFKLVPEVSERGKIGAIGRLRDEPAVGVEETDTGAQSRRAGAPLWCRS